MADDFFRAAVSFFAIIDPIGNILIFALVTQRSSREKRFEVALVAVLLAFGLVALFTLTGNSVLEFLDISPESFRIAAGALLVFPALRLVEHGDPVATPTNGLPGGALQAAVVPLAIPLLAGPGALATAASFAGRYGEGTTLAAAAAVLGLTFALFVGAPLLQRVLRESLFRAAARVIGVLLMAIAVDLIVSGIEAL